MPIPTVEELTNYENTPSRIRAIILDLTDEQLLSQPIPGEWSIHEILIHLPDSEAFGGERIRRVIAEDHPKLQAYPENIWANNLVYKQQNYRLALELFIAQRHANAALLRQLPNQAWERTGDHSEHGTLTLYKIFQTYLSHGEAHLQQIEQVKKRLT